MDDHISGHSVPSNDKVAVVNVNKAMEEHALQMLDQLKEMPGVDQRWLAIGRTHMEQAWMAINRAVLQPQRVKLTEL